MRDKYSVENIQVVSLDLNIRKRSVMFIGKLNTAGFISSLKG